MNRRANIVIRTSFGNTKWFTTNSLVNRVFGSILNNCSLDEVCAHSNSYHYGAFEIKALEFVDDIVDVNNGSSEAIGVVIKLPQIL